MAGADAREPLLEIDRLSVAYLTRTGAIPAVVDFSLRVDAGQSVGLVGESGCGKSTVAFALLRALGRNGRITQGRVRFRGRDLAALDAAGLRALRGGEIDAEVCRLLGPGAAVTVANPVAERP